MEFIKLWWMAFWRLSFVSIIFSEHGNGSAPFFLSLLFATIMIVGFKKSLHTFPVLKVVRGENPLINLELAPTMPNSLPAITNLRNDYMAKEDIAVDHNNDFSYSPVSNLRDDIRHQDEMTSPEYPVENNSAVRVQRSSNKGRMTGYEPYHMDNTPTPSSSKMVGTPGESLSSSSRISEKNKEMGTKGEMNFAKALKSTGILDEVYTFWSVPMPSESHLDTPDNRLNTDIDCIVVSNGAMFLIDLKFYRSGDVTYKNAGDNKIHAVDNVTGNIVGDDYTMSKNMEIAKERFSNFFGKAIAVKSAVVLMPNNDGEPMVAKDTLWTGDIPVYNLTTMLKMLKHQKGDTAPEVVLNPLRALKW